MSGDGSKVYVAKFGTSEVSVIDSNNVAAGAIATISAGDLAFPFIAAPVGTDLYVVNSRFAADPPVDGDVFVTQE